MFSISNLFSGGDKPQEGAPAQPAQQPTQGDQPKQGDQQQSGKLAETQQQVGTKATDGTAPNGTVPDNEATQEKSPLDQFATLWETDPNKEATGEFKPEQLDPAKLKEVISNVDMSSAISKENLAKIQAGGEDATQAFADSMNAVAQQVMMQSLMASNKMIASETEKAVQATLSKIPSIVKEQGLSNALTEQNPIYSNPAVKPVIDAVRNQLTTKFPDASSKELTDMAQNFVQAMATSLNPPKEDNSQGTDKQGEIDWDAWATQ